MEKKKIYFESILYFVGSISVAVLSFIISIMYSKMFSPSEYGLHSIVASTYSLLSQLCSAWIVTSMIRYSENYKNNKKEDEFYSSFMQIHILISIVFIIIPNTILYIFRANSNYRILFLIFSIIYFFEQLLLISNTILRIKGNVKLYNYNSVLNNFIKIMILLFLYYLLQYKSIFIISISMLLTNIIQGSYMIFKLNLIKYINIKLFNFDIIKKMFIYAFPLIGVSITSWVLNVSDRYIISFFYSQNEVGLYSYSYLLGNNLFWLLVNFIMLGAHPNIVNTWEKKGRNETAFIISDYLRMYFIIIIPACFGIIAISKKLFFVITDSRYHSGFNIFILVCIGISILGINQFTDRILELNKNTKIIFILNCIAAAINIMLNFTLIPKYGYFMGAVTTIISYLTYLILSLLFCNKIINIPIKYKSLLNVSISSFSMYIFVLILNKQFIYLEDSILIVMDIILGGLVYMIFLMLLREIKLDEIITKVKLRLNK